jgi:hypothetical protein
MASLAAIPVLTPWGVDCTTSTSTSSAHGRSPYLVDPRVRRRAGAAVLLSAVPVCVFRWVRPLSLQATMRIWTVFLCASFVGSSTPGPGRSGARAGARHELVTFCVLLLLQYPFVFALERGNTDTINVVFYTLAAFLFVRGRAGSRGWRRASPPGSSCRDRRGHRDDGDAGGGGPQVGRWTWLRFSGAPSPRSR